MNTVTRRSLGHLLAAACLVIAGTGALQAQTIGAADGRALVARGALLVDVRSAQEFSTGHVEGAINIPHLAQQSLQALGYTHVYNAGGYEDWLSADAAK
jgi:rhodanese-related sulfurtransferase